MRSEAEQSASIWRMVNEMEGNMKADRLKHGRPVATLEVVCDCECSRYLPCPADDDNKCRQAYIAHLKEIKATRDAVEAKA
jgi:hypothetical protein